MKIVYVHGHMFHIQTWSQVCARLKEEGIELYLFSQMQSADKAMALLENETIDIFLGQLFQDLPWRNELMESSKKAKMRVGLGWDMPPEFSSCSQKRWSRLTSIWPKYQLKTI